MSDLLDNLPELAALRDRLLATNSDASTLGRLKLTRLMFLLSSHIPLPADRLIPETTAVGISGVLQEDFLVLMTRHGFKPAKETNRARYWRVGDVYRMMRSDDG